ncbi:methyltransferase domain-containing protein [uncultured Methanolobus sp.]|uniref:class I SAM-dependent methyltransferase n=1 Tax=uncultured Methanolobus sp. TaxID=218300 RepID=UPI0029C92947|nr:methyltransferase domain-containing protein [uncultured Methanolobus sp.]
MSDIKARMFNKKASRAKSKADEIIKSLLLESGQNVADVGVEGGFFTLRFARLVGKMGKVYAVDTNKRFLDFVNNESKNNGIRNVITVLAEHDTFPVKDERLDMVFFRNVYHHLPDRRDYFRDLAESLKVEGKVVIIDYDGRGRWSFHRLFGHYVPKEIIIEEMNEAGYRLEDSHSFLSEESFLIFSTVE